MGPEPSSVPGPASSSSSSGPRPRRRRATADAAPADWIKTAISAHASFVADVNAAYVGAVRSVLN